MAISTNPTIPKIASGIHHFLQFHVFIAQINAANLAAGRPAVDAMATWSTAELSSPLPKAIFSKSSTDTQTRIEAPNVIGNRVVQWKITPSPRSTAQSSVMTYRSGADESHVRTQRSNQPSQPAVRSSRA